MKRSASELGLQEVINSTSTVTTSTTTTDHKADNFLSAADFDDLLPDVCSDYPFSPFRTRDIMDEFLINSGLAESLFGPQTIAMRQSSISAPIDSLSSICVGSQSLGNRPKVRDNQIKVTTSGSSPKQSEDEDVEIEAGPCEQSTNPADSKRIRRMVSNRQSARRSRKRKQAHVADLEFQVEKLTGENLTLYDQLTNATHQYRGADTDNQVLKSNVEALRARVKLAEDMAARGSFTCSLNQILQNYITSPQSLSNHNLWRVPNVSPSITVHGDDASYAGMTVYGQNSVLGLGNADISNATLSNVATSDL